MLSEKSLIRLELPEIRNMLAKEAVSEGAKEKSSLLYPSDDISVVRKNLEETSAAKDMMVLRSCPPFSGVKDVRMSVKRADIGGILNPKELLDIAMLLRASGSSISYFNEDKSEEKTAIDYLFNSLYSNKALYTKITSAIISETT